MRERDRRAWDCVMYSLRQAHVKIPGEPSPVVEAQYLRDRFVELTVGEKDDPKPCSSR